MNYTVKGGDSLSKIAAKYGMSWRDLYNANAKTIGGNPNLIRPGQVLTIPGSSKSGGSKSAPSNTLAKRVSDIAKQVKPVTKKFSDILPFEGFFDADLARNSAALRSDKYYNPILDEGNYQIDTDFSNRGLFRSGVRRESRGKFGQDIADQRQQMIEELFNIREQEESERYNRERELYEKDPTGFDFSKLKPKPKEFKYSPTPVGGLTGNNIFSEGQNKLFTT